MLCQAPVGYRRTASLGPAQRGSLVHTGRLQLSIARGLELANPVAQVPAYSSMNQSPKLRSCGSTRIHPPFFIPCSPVSSSHHILDDMVYDGAETLPSGLGAISPVCGYWTKGLWIDLTLSINFS